MGITGDDLLSTQEARAILFCSRASIERWVQSGRLTPAKQLPGIRGARLFNRSDVEALANERASA